MTKTLTVSLDCTGIEEADDGDTSYYGGSYLLDGTEYRGKGNDRSDSYRDDIFEVIHARCIVAFGMMLDLDADGDLQGAIGELDRNEGVIIIAQNDDGTFSVTAVES